MVLVTLTEVGCGQRTVLQDLVVASRHDNVHTIMMPVIDDRCRPACITSNSDIDIVTGNGIKTVL